MFNSIKKTILLTFATLMLTTSANAALITHDILFDNSSSDDVVFEKIGSITIETKNATEPGIVSTWESFTLFGHEIITQAKADEVDSLLFGYFEATFNPDDIFAGIEFMGFDVTGSLSERLNFNGIIEQASEEVLDIFNADGDLHAFGKVSFGKASVVPEPSIAVIFLLGLVALTRKQLKMK